MRTPNVGGKFLAVQRGAFDGGYGGVGSSLQEHMVQLGLSPVADVIEMQAPEVRHPLRPPMIDQFRQGSRS